MSSGSEILELKIEGNEINPKAVRPSEIAALLKDFESALLATIKFEHPAIDTNEVLVTFDNIKNESIGLFFSPNTTRSAQEVKSFLIASYISLTTSISKNDYSHLPNEAVQALKGISKFLKKHDCSANFKFNGEHLSTINSQTDIKLNKPAYLKGDTTIYGEIIDAGGDNPNIHIKLNDDYIIIIDADKEKVKFLGGKLYTFIGLKGLAKWDVQTSKIIDFKLYDIIEYTSGNVRNSFKKLKELTSGYWDNFNSSDEINSHLLRD